MLHVPNIADTFIKYILVQLNLVCQTFWYCTAILEKFIHNSHPQIDSIYMITWSLLSKKCATKLSAELACPHGSRIIQTTKRTTAQDMLSADQNTKQENTEQVVLTFGPRGSQLRGHRVAVRSGHELRRPLTRVRVRQRGYGTWAGVRAAASCRRGHASPGTVGTRYHGDLVWQWFLLCSWPWTHDLQILVVLGLDGEQSERCCNLCMILAPQVCTLKLLKLC
jgi:hypothetical protein